MHKIGQILYLLALLGGYSCFAQNLPSIPNPQAVSMPNYSTEKNTQPNGRGVPSNPALFNPDVNRQKQQTEQIMQEVERNTRLQNQAMQEAQADIATIQSRVDYSLPLASSRQGTAFYHDAFKKIIVSDSLFSVKDNNFLVENAFYENTLDQSEFDKIISNSGQFLISVMKEKNYDLDSNLAKNYMLFQFFSETLQLKNSKEKHLPFKYDFDDYMGINDYSKMFVSKLIHTGSGQCHSMPLLYLILAEEIGAEAYLSLSPSHSYIRFPDDNGKWYNIELTNGMFSTTSYILQSGYIKSEALQNKIYMENLSKKELLARHLTDLASGYIYKFGYDEFAQTIINKALELYPNSINARMVNANIATARLRHVLRQLGINPADSNQRDNILYYPEAVELLRDMHRQYGVIDNLGYEHMPPEAYQKWLQDMTNEKQKQENKAISEQFKGILSKQTKTLKD